MPSSFAVHCEASIGATKIGSSLAIVAVILSATAHAASEPLPTSDLDPWLAGYGITPALPSAGTWLNRTQFTLEYAVANLSLDQASATEHLIADAEVHRWQITLTRSLSDQFSVRAELPYQSLSGGNLDSFIENFHHVFGFPNGNRASWPRDRLFASYQRNGHTLFQLDRSTAGIGDISLRGGWHFDRGERHTSSLWLSLKLPTGAADKMTGSGSADLALSLTASQLLNDFFDVYEQASLNGLSTGRRMSTLQHHVVWNGTAGMDWRWTQRLSILVQLDAHSRVFDSDLRLLGPAVQLSFGPRYRTAHWQSTLIMGEDLLVDASPDVQFQFSIGRRF